MRRIINSTYVSLDGLIELLERWHFEYLNEASAKFESDQLSACDALLMGRRTYESFAEAWPPRTGDVADKINGMRKYVVSTTMEKADWANSAIIGGDLVKEITRIKQEPGQDILMYGFGPVAHTLLQHGLLDEVRLWVHPVFVGAGEVRNMLFHEGSTAKMHLIGTRTLDSGVVILSYRPATRSA